MQEHKRNLFFEKFSLLNSQEHNEDIKWSSSSSSEYENTSYYDKLCNNNKTCTRKRKRKKKVSKNTSNLDITIIDAFRDHKKDCYREKSPILLTKCVSSMSPILVNKFPPNKPSSPILCLKSLHPKSPILMAKTTSPKCLIKVRKKLDYNEEKRLRESDSTKKNLEKIPFSNNITTDRSKICVIQDEDLNQSIKKKVLIESKDSSLEISRADDRLSLKNSLNSSDGSETSLKAKCIPMNNVKNYFDSHFSSENTSQNISDTPTPEESSKNEVIDILSCRTQMVSNIQLTKHDSTNTTNSDTSAYFEKNKKVKYKKGGLAYRLNVLLKKQNAHVSLWQHERFLAGTSNFVIPKGEHVVFCIQKIDFKYGCYLIDAVDMKNEKYVIFINSSLVNINISTDSVLKLYEPYRTLECKDKDYRIIINVCKFECFDLKNRCLEEKESMSGISSF